MPLPTFVIAGAQKSGTTTLHDLLGQLPDVWVSDPKELHFFANRHGRGLDWYVEQFQPGVHHRAWGESTPSYIYLDRAREAMVDALPSARFIVVLREPVGRAYSHYWFARSKGRESLESFEAAIAAEPERLTSSKHGQRPAYSYLDRGHYLRQLLALEEGVGRDRILAILTDDLDADPRAAVRRVCRFLDVDVRGVDSIEIRRRNTFADQALRQNGKRREAGVGSLAPAAAVTPYPPIDPDFEQELRERFRVENEQLARWLDRNLTSWMPG